MIKLEVYQIKELLCEGRLDKAVHRIEKIIQENRRFKEIDFRYFIGDFYQLTKKALLEEISYEEEFEYQKELVAKLISILNKYIHKKQVGEKIELEELKILKDMLSQNNFNYIFSYLDGLEQKLPYAVIDRVINLRFQYFFLNRYNSFGILKNDFFTQEVNKIRWKLLNLIDSLANTDLINYYNENPSVFVIIAFHESMNLVYETIKNTGEKYNLKPVRVKDVLGDYKITDKIIDLIKKAKFVVVDLSLERPNVYFELGYARGLGKTVITICDMKTNIHFDIKDWTCLYYKDNQDLSKNLDERFRIEIENS